MPADGDITIRSILREHNRFAMPEGFFQYSFNQKGDIYGISLLNGCVASMAIGFTRFMYYGNIKAVSHLSVPVTFVAATYTSAFIIMKKKRDQDIEDRKQGKGVMKFTQRVPMSPRDMKRLKENPENPFTPENLRQFGVPDTQQQPDETNPAIKRDKEQKQEDIFKPEDFKQFGVQEPQNPDKKKNT